MNFGKFRNSEIFEDGSLLCYKKAPTDAEGTCVTTMAGVNNDVATARREALTTSREDFTA